MSTTMMVCLGIISLCTLAVGVTSVMVQVQDKKLKRIEEKNKKMQFEIPAVKYEKWLPYCPDIFGFTKHFECSNCHTVVEMPVLNDNHDTIVYYNFCPYCASAMLHKNDE